MSSNNDKSQPPPNLFLPPTTTTSPALVFGARTSHGVQAGLNQGTVPAPVFSTGLTSPPFSSTFPALSSTSPAYSSTFPALSSTYTPFSSTSPAYSSTSPTYSSTSLAYSSISTPFSSISPAYSSTSPTYSSTSPAYPSTTPAFSSNSTMFSTIASPVFSTSTSAASPMFSSSTMFSTKTSSSGFSSISTPRLFSTNITTTTTTTSSSMTSPAFSSTASLAFSTNTTSASFSSTASLVFSANSATSLPSFSSTSSPVFSTAIPVFGGPKPPVFASLPAVASTTISTPISSSTFSPSFSQQEQLAATPTTSTDLTPRTEEPLQFGTQARGTSATPVVIGVDGAKAMDTGLVSDILKAKERTGFSAQTTELVFGEQKTEGGQASQTGLVFGVHKSKEVTGFSTQTVNTNLVFGTSTQKTEKGSGNVEQTTDTLTNFGAQETEAGAKEPPFSTPPSTLPTSNVNIFGGSDRKSSVPIPSLFGGATKSKNESSATLQKTKEPLPTPQESKDVASSSSTAASDLFGKSSGKESGSSQKAPTTIFGGTLGTGGGKAPGEKLSTSSAQVPVSFGSKIDTVIDNKPRFSSATIHPVSQSEDKKPIGNVGSSVPPIFGGCSKSVLDESTPLIDKINSFIEAADSITKSKIKELPKLQTNVKLEDGEIFDEPESPSILKSEVTSPTGSGGSPEFSKKELTKIIVAMIPESCMGKETLKRHFSKFGEIKRLTLNAKVNQATVQYCTHSEASRAKRKGKKIHPKVPEVKIFYGTPARRRSEEGNNEAMMYKKKAIKTLQYAHQSTPSDLDPYTPLDRSSMESAKIPPLLTPNIRPPPKESTRLPQPLLHKLRPSKLSEPTTTRKLTPRKEVKVKPKPAVVSESKESSSSNIREYDINSEGSDSKDRALILKERDRLLRKKNQRSYDLKKAKYLSATCPDMCPELERYTRDYQNDLSSFEVTSRVLDHRKMIKKFSRSSADKEEPLPHELRPGPVLLKTMDYLMCNVINRGDEEGMMLDVWYNYLWNRTRGVRNDLMQQQLTDSVAVVIIERCTRFHIYAAARLCAEGEETFDAKMNTEHLTKSLQTLKELYHDLAEKGEYFETEAEFRAYEMLLNLNDGETIVHQYSTFREEVQKSSDVQFALKVILAVMFNNYIKFFKLIEQSTHLQGCLLHRYFRQVRSRGLSTMMRAYKTKQRNPQHMPLQRIVHMLGFEDELDAKEYLTIHGIKITEGNVILDRKYFISHPKSMPSAVRPLLVVEAKRNCTVAEVIQGGPLPENPLLTYTPHNSFNEQGYLKPESRDASDQQRPVEPPAVVLPNPEAHQNYQLLSHMRDVYKMLEGEAIKEGLTKICSEVVENRRHEDMVDETARIITKEILLEEIASELGNLSKEGCAEVLVEEKEKQRKILEEKERECRFIEKMNEKVSQTIHTSYIDQLVQEMSRQISQETVNEVEDELAIQDLTDDLPKRCLEEVLFEELKKMSSDTIVHATAVQELKIKKLQQRIAQRKILEVFQAWRKQTHRSRMRKRSQEAFPAACSQLTLKEQNEALGWGYQRKPAEDMSVLKLSKLESSLNLCLKKLTVRNQLIKECAWLSLPLKSKLSEEVSKLSPMSTNILNRYYKILVCQSSSANPNIMQWLRAKLGSKENLDEPLDDYFRVVSRKTGLEYAWVIKESSLDTLTLDDARGTSLVLFVSSSMGTKDPQYRKLTQLLTMLPRVSCREIFYEAKNSTPVGWNLKEEDLLEPEVSESLQSLLFEVWGQCSKQVQVASSHLNSFVAGFVAKMFVDPVLQTHSERMADRKSPMSPSTLIDLFNSVVAFLMEVINDDAVKTLDWPPPELCHLNQAPPPTWNTSDISHIWKLLGRLKLPELNLEGFGNWDTICKAVQSYALKASGLGGDATGLASHLTTILSNTKKIFEPVFGCEEENFADCELHVLQLPWTELIYACVSHRLAALPAIAVYYQPQRLENFKFPRSWWEACDTSDSEWAQAVIETEFLGSRKRKAEYQDSWSNDAKVQKVPTKLMTDLEIEKQKCAEFDKKFEDTLLIDAELRLFFEEVE